MWWHQGRRMGGVLCLYELSLRLWLRFHMKQLRLYQAVLSVPRLTIYFKSRGRIAQVITTNCQHKFTMDTPSSHTRSKGRPLQRPLQHSHRDLRISRNPVTEPAKYRSPSLLRAHQLTCAAGPEFRSTSAKNRLRQAPRSAAGTWRTNATVPAATNTRLFVVTTLGENALANASTRISRIPRCSSTTIAC